MPDLFIVLFMIAMLLCCLFFNNPIGISTQKLDMYCPSGVSMNVYC